MKHTHQLLAAAVLALLAAAGCDGKNRTSAPAVKSASGVQAIRVELKPDIDGFTAEQRNIRDRLLMDNHVGAIQHLYVISAESGQILYYSTVRGKVTSGGKRISPTGVVVKKGKYKDGDNIVDQPELRGVPINVGGRACRTGEVLQDDGTYGSSTPYVYWWDSKRNYHQHFFTDDQIVHVSSQYITVHQTTINLDLPLNR